MDAKALGMFIRSRRQSLQPEDVGLSRGPRRRAEGLRREEVAELAGMSSDYYARLERGGGPQPSDQMTAAIARALRLTLSERDHLFRLAGHPTPAQDLRDGHVSPGLMRVLDRLADTPAQVIGPLGETLAETGPARALLGDGMAHIGASRSAVWRWFTAPTSRTLYPAADHEHHGRVYAAQLRRTLALQGPSSSVARFTSALQDVSEEFSAYWRDQDVETRYSEVKRFVHPIVGELELHCQVLVDPDRLQSLLVFTAVPGSDSAERLALLTVLGTQRIATDNSDYQASE